MAENGGESSTGGPFEVEMKFPIPDPEALRNRLVAAGFAEGPTLEQEDIYLSHPSRDFAATGEAFRIRRTNQAFRLTYKGPKLGGPTKTREEIEVGFDAPSGGADAMRMLLERLGFRAVAAVRKERVSFQGNEAELSVEVTLDQVAELGWYAEVEAIAPDRPSLPAVQAAIESLASRLTLGTPEPRSYLRMLLERRDSAGRP